MAIKNKGEKGAAVNSSPQAQDEGKTEKQAVWAPNKLSMFRGKLRCYVAGVDLHAGQEITLNPKDAEKYSHNVNLEFMGLRDGAEGEAVVGADPRVGRNPGDLRLISPAGAGMQSR